MTLPVPQESLERELLSAGLGYELVSTGGSANAIEGAGVPVTRVEELTGFPEMLDGTPLPYKPPILQYKHKMIRICVVS